MAQVSVKKSYDKGAIKILVSAKSSGWRSGDASISVNVSCNISTTEARQLAADIIAAADVEDARREKDKASDARRSAWREREIAAGRMVSMSPAEFLNRASK